MSAKTEWDVDVVQRTLRVGVLLALLAVSLWAVRQSYRGLEAVFGWALVLSIPLHALLCRVQNARNEAILEAFLYVTRRIKKTVGGLILGTVDGRMHKRQALMALITIAILSDAHMLAHALKVYVVVWLLHRFLKSAIHSDPVDRALKWLKQPSVLVWLLLSVPILLFLLLVPQAAKEVLMGVRLIKRLVNRYEVLKPIKSFVLQHLNKLLLRIKPIIQLEEFVELPSLLDASRILQTKAVSWYECLTFNSDQLQAIWDTMSANQEQIMGFAKTALENTGLLMGKMPDFSGVLTKLTIFALTLAHFARQPKDVLAYLDDFLADLDPEHRLSTRIRRIIDSIVYGAVFKVLGDLLSLCVAGCLFALPVYVLPSFLIACVVLLPYVHGYYLLAAAVLITLTDGPLVAVLGFWTYRSIKAAIRRHMRSQYGTFPKGQVLVGFYRFGLVGAVVWPVVNAIPWVVWSLLFSPRTQVA